VIYQRYQDSFAEPPAEVLGNVVLGVRAALGRLEVEGHLVRRDLGGWERVCR
jgi:hypothetical protein